jgi:SAM-dependent methyltransferase
MPDPDLLDREFSVRLIPESVQDGESFELITGGRNDVVSLHDYARIYAVPGLYEEVVQVRLGCRSPQMTAELVASGARRLGISAGDLRVLDLGAGNGGVGSELAARGIAQVVGVDHIAAARDACARDHPGVYRDYVVDDLATMTEPAAELLRRERLNCVSCAGALGGAHASPVALVRAINMLEPPGLVVLTIGLRWLDPGATDHEQFAGFLTGLLSEGHLAELERRQFVHRLTMAGDPIPYLALSAVRVSTIPLPFVPGSFRGGGASLADRVTR